MKTLGFSLWIFSFLYAALTAVLVQGILLPYVFPSWHAGNGLLVAGDWNPMHESALLLAEKIRLYGWSQWTLWPPPRGWIESGIAGAIYAALLPKAWVLIPLNAALHATNTWILYRALLIFSTDRPRLALFGALPLLFFPSNLLWTAQIHKDGGAILGSLLFMYGWLLAAHRRMKGFALILLGTGVIFFVRPYLAYVFNILSYVYAAVILLSLFVHVRRLTLSPVRASTFATSIALTLLVMTMGPRNILSLLSESKTVNRITPMASMTSDATMGSELAPQAAEPPKPAKIDPTDLHNITYPTEFEIGKRLIHLNTKVIHASDGYRLVEELRAKNPTAGLPYDPAPLDRLGFTAPLYVHWERSWYLPRSIDHKIMGLADVRRGFLGYMEARSNIDTRTVFHNASQVIAYIPRAIQIAFFAPFPSNWFQEGSNATNTAFRRFVGGEMLFSYLLLPFFLFAIVYFKARVDFWILFSFNFFFLVFYSIIAPNLGTLHRFRYGFTCVWLGFGILGVFLLRDFIAQNWKKLRLLTSQTEQSASA